MKLSVILLAIVLLPLAFYFKHEIKATVTNLMSFTTLTLANQRGSFTISTAFVEGFKTNIYMMSQQKNARCFGKSRNERQNSKTDFYERIGSNDGQESTERHGDTPINNTPHSRRAVTLTDADYGDLIDKLDRVKLLINPDNAYVQTAIAYLNRKKDDVFIAAALGNARSGDDGATLTALPSAQRIISLSDDLTTEVDLNVSTLTRVSRLFDDADVDPDSPRFFAYTGSQKQSLLNQEQVTSSDYAAVKALVDGKIDSFMGFKFILTNRVPVTAATIAYDNATGVVGGAADATLAAGARRCFAWVEDGMLSSLGMDITAKVSERNDKKHSTQIYVAQSVGAVRMEEEKVVEVLCIES